MSLLIFRLARIPAPTNNVHTNPFRDMMSPGYKRKRYPLKGYARYPKYHFSLLKVQKLLPYTCKDRNAERYIPKNTPANTGY